MTISRSTSAAIALTFIIVSALIWALARYRGGPSAPPAPPVVRDAATPLPRAASVKAKKATLKKAETRMIVKLEDTAEPAKVRGARLRDKGEAMGGRAPDRVDMDTATTTPSQ